MTSINGSRLNKRLARLAEIGRTSEGGVTRPSLTPEYLEAEALVAGWMEEAGLSTRIDAVGNLIGRREGNIPGHPAIMLGSHIDTVINGGKYDGMLGVIGGIEVAQALQENGIALDHALEVVAFIEEESTRWTVSTLGSHAMTGQIDPGKILQKRDRQGKTMAETMLEAGINPDNIINAKRDPGEIACFLELHIEQGAVLDNIGLPVGIVTGIAAQVILELTLKGKADHAGATPMDLRRDAMIGAARLVLAARETAREAGPTCVATVGRLEIKPGAVNVVPGEVFMTFDIRDIHKGSRDKMVEKILDIIPVVAKENNLEFNIVEASRLTPVLLPGRMVETIVSACEKLNVPVHKMPSGASHDAQIMTAVTDVGMIFIRSKDGISHSPTEFSEPDDIALGASVMYDTVILLDSDKLS